VTIWNHKLLDGLAPLAIVGVLLAAAGPALAAQGDAISLSGKISQDMRYRLRIDYATTVNDQSCQFEDQITGMWIRQLESRYEAPQIDGGAHGLTVSIGHPGGPGVCDWRPSVVYLCVGARTAADEALNCRSLFVVTPFASLPSQSISLTCEPQSWTCITTDGRDPTQQVSGLGGQFRLDIASGALKSDSRSTKKIEPEGKDAP
jgi:hypothetical protein